MSCYGKECKPLAGGVAGLIAQTATYPLHIVRRRMQVHGRGLLSSTFQLNVRASCGSGGALMGCLGTLFGVSGVFGSV